MTTTQRLETVENELEIVKRLLTSSAQNINDLTDRIDRNAQQIESNNGQIDNLTKRIDRNAEQIEHNNRQIQSNAEQVNELAVSQKASQERLDSFIFHSERIENKEVGRLERIEAATEVLQGLCQNLARNFEAQRQEFREWKITVNASLERIDRILDYLMRNSPRDEG